MAGASACKTRHAGRKPRKAPYMVAHAPEIGKSAVDRSQNAWVRALERAREVATRKPCYIPRLDAYRVHSDRTGNDYMVHPVEVDGQLTYHCDCTAGVHGLVCWHAARIAALPYEIERRRKHREARRAERRTHAMATAGPDP